MTGADADQDSDFEAAFATGLGLTARRTYRTLAANMRTRLLPGERVAGVAPTREQSSSADMADDARWDGALPPSRTGTMVAYFTGGLVLGVVLDVAWPVIAALFVAALVLEVWLWRRRRPPGRRDRPRSMRSLAMVTDRRLIVGVHPNEFRELPLERVQEVRVRTGTFGVATVRVRADGGDMEIHVINESPKRRAVPAARAIAEAIREGAASGAGRPSAGAS